MKTFWQNSRLLQYKYVLLYLVAIVLANMMALWFGPKITVVNSFMFIGLGLAVRAGLHDEWKGKHLWIKMLALIGAGSLLSFVINKDVGQIALGSFVGFAVSGIVATAVYGLLDKHSRSVQYHGSNVPAVVIDSILFPTIAFGEFLPWIILGQIVVKLAGGFVWNLILKGKKK